MEKTKTVIVRLLSFVALVLAFVLTLQLLSFVFVPKSSQGHKGSYKNITNSFLAEDDNTVDVFVIGNSNVYRGVSPMAMWNELGTASCVSGKALQKPKKAYELLEKMYKHQNPELVIIDTDMFFSSLGEKFTLRKLGESVKTVVKTVNACRKNFDDSVVSAMSYYYPVFKYHTRWQELAKADFTDRKGSYRSAYKGFISDTAVEPYNGGYDYMTKGTDADRISNSSVQCLDSMIELCKSKGSKVILIDVPSVEWNNVKHDEMKDYAKRNNLTFIDFNVQGSIPGFDWKTDTRDCGQHLNSYGAQKLTKTLCEMLEGEMNFPDRRGDSRFKSWDRALTEYHNELNEGASSI